MNKSSIIEYIENIYGLANNCLKNKNSVELRSLLKELNLIEDKIRSCYDKEILSNYELLLKDLINKIEGIINE